ncbi:MAG: No hits [uncultured Sulfurovum sp.]|uniref:No hits n=1 Tax=uncultured Sulfurovum sp. TaxID=269237 RepID=A0A6S6U554_9BACT|nr:MAG: No hits [uncultured Sulfurovum sp.]
MKKLLRLTLLFSLQFIHAMTLSSGKTDYSTNDTINIQFNDMTGLNKDWIGIYPKDSNNDWANVIHWKWTDDKSSGNLVFTSLPQGKYEVRAFYNNSFKTEAIKSFNVAQEGESLPTNIETDKKVYNENEPIQVVASNMLGHHQDWIALYTKESNNEWKNVLQWEWTQGQRNSTIEFDGLRAGEYEVRAFFKNSYQDEARYAFSVTGATPITLNIDESFLPEERIQVSISGLSKTSKDWVGIYKKNDSVAWENVLQWSWAKGEGERELYNFVALSSGEYEVRVFFNNSFTVQASKSFKVTTLANEDSEVLQLAKEQCLNNGSSTRSILCSNEKNIVYVLTEKRDANYDVLYGFYRVSIAEGNEFVTTIEQRSTPSYVDPKTSEWFQEKLKDTPLYGTVTQTQEADERGSYSFYFQDKAVLSFSYWERDGQLTSVETSENGTKLTVKYPENIYVDQKNVTKVYDISNPSEPQIISTVKN